MTDFGRRKETPTFGRRGEIPPPARSANGQGARLAALGSAIGPLGEWVSTHTAKLTGAAGWSIEAVRRRFCSDRGRPADHYDEPRSEIVTLLVSCRRIFWGLAAFSGLSNLLMLTGSFFMLQVYDRVLPGRSVPTLLALLSLAIVLYLFQGGLDLVRSRIGVRIGRHLDERLGARVFDALVRLPLKTRGDGDGLQPLRDLDQVRSFLSSGGPTALFDLPWMPVYLGICFLFHFWIGITRFGWCGGAGWRHRAHRASDPGTGEGVLAPWRVADRARRGRPPQR